ncbi:PPPDE putative peptidase domain-containing protein [Gongronella butleri]|nr:PPPDE putative peptidase domain-containing protein [Gongronella butleri]
MLNTFKTLFTKSGAADAEQRHEVFVNVYDMLQPSFLTAVGYYALGIGIYHSGVEICGKEYCFGGHEFKDITGVFAVEAKVGPPGLLFKQSISIGHTRLSDEQIQQVIHDISKEYVGPTYNLLTRNCNHFTDEFCHRLTGKHAPSWINRAAKLGTMFPCVIPTEWVEPPELEGEVVPSTPSPAGDARNGKAARAPNAMETSTPMYTSQPAPLHINTAATRQDTAVAASPSSAAASPSKAMTAATPSSPFQPTSSRKSSITSADLSHHIYSLAAAPRPYSSASSSMRRPSGTESDTLFARTTSPISTEEIVKEPDSHKPEILRSATQLSITASFQELDHIDR